MKRFQKLKTPSVVAATQGANQKTSADFQRHDKRVFSHRQAHNFSLRWITRKCGIPSHLAPTIAFLAGIKGGQAND
ncbi:MAG: hypothetical protein HWE25_11590 [Alphaproteobacteria bacterium]|nr:hypothetical protein [Alphaproteobacteria bacterium]